MRMWHELFGRMMKFATWNVNSIRQRQDHVLDYLAREQPDVLALQEIKCQTEVFPVDVFKTAGYDSIVVGQKSYNGVAILTRHAHDITHTALPGWETDPAQARYVEIRSCGLVFGNLYCPTAIPAAVLATTPSWRSWRRWRSTRMACCRPDRILSCWAITTSAPPMRTAPRRTVPDDALVRPQSRAAFRRLLWLGLTDALRALHPVGRFYTFWDYQAAAWQRDSGLRIDHALLSPRGRTAADSPACP